MINALYIFRYRDTYYFIIIFVLSCVYWYTTNYFNNLRLDLNDIINSLNNLKLVKLDIDHQIDEINSLLAILENKYLGTLELKDVLTNHYINVSSQIADNLSTLVTKFNLTHKAWISLTEDRALLTVELNSAILKLIDFYNNIALLTNPINSEVSRDGIIISSEKLILELNAYADILDTKKKIIKDSKLMFSYTNNNFLGYKQQLLNSSTMLNQNKTSLNELGNDSPL